MAGPSKAFLVQHYLEGPLVHVESVMPRTVALLSPRIASSTLKGLGLESTRLDRILLAWRIHAFVPRPDQWCRRTLCHHAGLSPSSASLFHQPSEKEHNASRKAPRTLSPTCLQGTSRNTTAQDSPSSYRPSHNAHAGPRLDARTQLETS